MANSKDAIVIRTIRLHGRKTSLSLEEPFWEALRTIAKNRGTSVTVLIVAIRASSGKTNLLSATRVYALEYYRQLARPMASTPQQTLNEVEEPKVALPNNAALSSKR
jgi:predicted DNA-binding ribbon-helix-helix protein